jgi:hypothetical protein
VAQGPENFVCTDAPPRAAPPGATSLGKRHHRRALEGVVDVHVGSLRLEAARLAGPARVLGLVVLLARVWAREDLAADAAPELGAVVEIEVREDVRWRSPAVGPAAGRAYAAHGDHELVRVLGLDVLLDGRPDSAYDGAAAAPLTDDSVASGSEDRAVERGVRRRRVRRVRRSRLAEVIVQDEVKSEDVTRRRRLRIEERIVMVVGVGRKAFRRKGWRGRVCPVLEVIIRRSRNGHAKSRRVN